MFANLVESNPHRGDYARKGSFFLGTLAVYGVIFLMLGVGGIYAYNNHIENRDLELLSMVSTAEETEAPVPTRVVSTRSAAGGGGGQRVPVFRSRPVLTSPDPTRTQSGVHVSSPVQELPQGMIHRIGVPSSGHNIFGPGGKEGTGPGGDGTGAGTKGVGELVGETPPPTMKAAANNRPPASTPPRSVGVVNSMATALPKPVYTAIAKAAGAAGVVQVQVVIDETGRVISARAVSGHPLLLKESERAAYQARFTPTYLSNQPVKVSGVITYNFVLR